MVRSFPPIASPRARILILGSMPGRASLAAREYYAHPQNLFWPIVGALTGAHRELPYARRVRALAAAGIALWDVLAACERDGSLDAAIDRATLVPNDFGAFFARHRAIERVLFNGQMAAECFRRHVEPALEATLLARLAFVRLPSTSPANASIGRARKQAEWQAAISGGRPRLSPVRAAS